MNWYLLLTSVAVISSNEHQRGTIQRACQPAVLSLVLPAQLCTNCRLLYNTGLIIFALLKLNTLDETKVGLQGECIKYSELPNCGVF